MGKKPDRREFLLTSAAALGAATGTNAFAAQNKKQPGLLSVSSYNGLPAVNKAVEVMKAGGSTLDAVISGVNIVEDDPNDFTVGYGGLPNEDGIVELDSSVMDGPSGNNAGAVASLRNIKNPSKVARLVMERTDHVLIVGEGALRFARMHGFQEENLLTDYARKRWLEWKEQLSDDDDWFPAGSSYQDYGKEKEKRPTGTINCLALNENGDISGVTTTSGLFFKIPGRVGDSPIIGAGLYVDNNVGAAGSTGRGEEAMKFCGSLRTVMHMEHGKSPVDACLETLKRISDNYPRAFVETFNINFYALNKQGQYGSASMWGSDDDGFFAVNDGTGGRHEHRAYLHNYKDNRLRSKKS